MKNKYIVLTIVLFIIECLIAIFVKDNFIRPYFGDVLVVILIYSFVRIFYNHKFLAHGVLVFSFVIEYLQYFKIIEILHLSHIKLARIIIGTSFSNYDLLCYFVGYLVILLIIQLEKKIW